MGRRARAHARAPASYHGRSAHAPTGAKSRGPQSPITPRPTRHARAAWPWLNRTGARTTACTVPRVARSAHVRVQPGTPGSLPRSTVVRARGKNAAGWGEFPLGGCARTYSFAPTLPVSDSMIQPLKSPQLLGESSKQYAADLIRIKANDPSSINA